ncbi:MAG: hypothetical protein RB296_08280 [Acidobacteriota bacterium]|jgi:hypothetical protein|nr:hypothetical protein [Acidobacteriota bacterium]
MKRICGIFLMTFWMTSMLAALGTAQKVSQILAIKQLGFELSVGVGLDRPGSLLLRTKGTDELMRQYAEGSGASLVEAGRFRENIPSLPLRVALAYRLDSYWTVKGGLGLSFGVTSGEKSFALGYSSGTKEEFDVNVRNRLTLVSPFLEVEHVLGRFAVFAGVGLHWGRLSHRLQVKRAAGGTIADLTEEIGATGNGPLAYFGGAYRHALSAHTALLFRLEMGFSRIGGWDGEKNSLESDNMGNQLQRSAQGELTRYEWNPYGRGWVGYWDLAGVVADEVLYRGVSALSSAFSGVRFSIGFCF